MNEPDIAAWPLNGKSAARSPPRGLDRHAPESECTRPKSAIAWKSSRGRSIRSDDSEQRRDATPLSDGGRRPVSCRRGLDDGHVDRQTRPRLPNWPLEYNRSYDCLEIYASGAGKARNGVASLYKLASRVCTNFCGFACSVSIRWITTAAAAVVGFAAATVPAIAENSW